MLFNAIFEFLWGMLGSISPGVGIAYNERAVSPVWAQCRNRVHLLPAIAMTSTLPIPWWRRQMETFSALLAICAGNSPVPGEFPTQRPVRRSFDVYFDLRPNKRLSKQSWGWWFETPSRPFWRRRNATMNYLPKTCQGLMWSTIKYYPTECDNWKQD